MLVLSAPHPRPVHVEPGDTLWGLARQYHTSVAELRRLNHLPSDTIYAGRTLLVPVAGTGPVGYRVRAGDTASEIAAAHDVPLARLAERNGLHGRMVIRTGQLLWIPRDAPALVERPEPASVAESAGRHRDELAGRPRPPVARVHGLIVRTARALGVEPALALAVARQESGLHMNVVSSADAIGIMQVLPSTGDWLADDVLHRRLDLLDPEDNVLAGVALLRVLTRSAPLHQAVAGYYQGLASVRAHGMFSDTRRYVANVLALRERYG